MDKLNSKTYLLTGILLFIAGLSFNIFQVSWISNTLFTVALVFLIISAATYKK